MSRVPNPDEARRLARLRFDRPPAGEAPRTEAAIDWPKSWTPDDIAWVKRQIIGEYRREAASAAPPEPPRPDHHGQHDATCKQCHYPSEPPRPDLDADQIARIIAAAEGFPGDPSLKNRAIADRIASDYRGVAAPEGLDVDPIWRRVDAWLRSDGWTESSVVWHEVRNAIYDRPVGARLSESGSPPPWRDDSDACPTCAHRPHDPGKCKARYRVTLAEDEEGDSCLCESGSPTPPGEERP